MLASAVEGRAKATVFRRALTDLADWSFILFRRHLGAYSVYAGSDFDVESALRDSLENLRQVDFRELRSLARVGPILAKRHYHDTGALRWFDVDLVTVESLLAPDRMAPPSRGAMGRFMLAIPTAGDSSATARRACQLAAESAHPSLVVGFSNQATQVLQHAREFVAMTGSKRNVQSSRGMPSRDARSSRE